MRELTYHEANIAEISRLDCSVVDMYIVYRSWPGCELTDRYCQLISEIQESEAAVG